MPGVLQAQYQVYLYSTAGNLAAVITNFRKLTYRQAVNQTGTFTMVIGEPSQVGVPLDSYPALFVEDAIIVIRRQIPGILAWYTDFVGFVRGSAFDTDDAGNLTSTARGVGTLDLVNRRVIAYPAGTRFTEKSAVSDTAMYQFVNENVAAAATTANGRYASGVTTGFTIAAPAGFGIAWQGARHMQSVLAVIQGISTQLGPGSGEFYVTTTVGGGSVAHAMSIVSRIGTDRTATVTFSKPRGNVGSPKSANDWTNARNRVYVLGPGEKSDRIVITSNSVTRQANSPWAVYEKTREATQEQSGASLSNLGATEIEVSRPVVSYAFSPIETVSTRYGVDYFLGDTVTAVTDDGTSLVLRILGVTIDNDGDSGAESISLEVTVMR